MRNEGFMVYWVNTKNLILNFQTLVTRLRIRFSKIYLQKGEKTFFDFAMKKRFMFAR